MESRDEVNGKRFQSSSSFLEDRSAQWAVKLLVIASEVNRSLTFHWLSCMGKSLKANTRAPIFTLLDPRTSIIVQSLQYLSSCIMDVDGGHRLLFLWSTTGYETYGDFCAGEPDKTRQIRRVFMLLAGWIFRRHFCCFNRFPYSLLQLGDEGADAVSLDAVSNMWDQRHHCCVPPGFCRDLKKRDLTSSDLKSPKWKQVLRWTAGTIQCSIADVEAMHSQNRIHSGSAFSSIAAKFVNKESGRVQKEAETLQKTTVEQNNGRLTSDGSGLIKSRCGVTVRQTSLKSKNPKAMSALELFRKRYIDQHKVNQKINPCSKEFWDDVKVAFNGLTPEEKAIYEAMSQESKIKATLARDERERAQTVSTQAGVVAQPESRVDATHASTLTISNPDFSHDCGQLLHGQVLPLWQLCELTAGESDSGNICQRVSQDVQTHLAPNKNSNVLGDPSHPLAESTLEKAWQVQLSQGLTGKQIEANYHKDAERTVR